jgi:DNA repair exonuclease SbcCD nuclease subunit
MKIGIFGDLHYTSRGPTRRLDNYFETQMEKSSEAFHIFRKNNCGYVVQPGDMFDTHTVSNEVEARTILLFRKWMEDRVILCVSGQHDISGHSLHTLKNSPLAVLQSAGVVKILSERVWGECLKGEEKDFGFYGASYGEPIPEPDDENTYNILVIHKMIGDRELFPGQELTKPNQFLRNNPKYNLVICGDYHYRFSSQYGGRTIVNAGCIVRKTISKFDLEHKPSVAIFDTETNEVEFFELEHRPVKEVFNLSRETKTDRIKTEQLIQALKNQGVCRGIKWKDALVQVLESRKASCSEGVRRIIDECLEEAQK